MAQAVRDWGRCKHLAHWPDNILTGNKDYPRAGFRSPRAELVSFFRGEWFELMADEMGVDPDYFRAQLVIK
mgnify:CR=1 FL=1